MITYSNLVTLWRNKIVRYFYLCIKDCYSQRGLIQLFFKVFVTFYKTCPALHPLFATCVTKILHGRCFNDCWLPLSPSIKLETVSGQHELFKLKCRSLILLVVERQTQTEKRLSEFKFSYYYYPFVYKCLPTVSWEIHKTSSEL